MENEIKTVEDLNKHIESRRQSENAGLNKGLYWWSLNPVVWYWKRLHPNSWEPPKWVVNYHIISTLILFPPLGIFMILNSNLSNLLKILVIILSLIYLGLIIFFIYQLYLIALGNSS